MVVVNDLLITFFKNNNCGAKNAYSSCALFTIQIAYSTFKKFFADHIG
jgi:hypothetical protein